MTIDHNCGACSVATGCTGRKTEDKNAEEISMAPYLVFGVVVIVLASVVFRWLF